MLETGWSVGCLTARKYDPYKIHKKIIYPKIVRLRPEVSQTVDIMVKQACCVVQLEAVKLAHADHGLERVAKRMFGYDHPGNAKG